MSQDYIFYSSLVFPFFSVQSMQRLLFPNTNLDVYCHGNFTRSMYPCQSCLRYHLHYTINKVSRTQLNQYVSFWNKYYFWPVLREAKSQVNINWREVIKVVKKIVGALRYILPTVQHLPIGQKSVFVSVPCQLSWLIHYNLTFLILSLADPTFSEMDKILWPF